MGLLFDKSINEQSSSSFLPDSSLQPCSAHPYLPLHLFPFVLPLLLYSFPFLSSSDTPPSCLLTPLFGSPGVASALWYYYLCPFAQPEFTYWVPTSGGIEEWCIETVEIQDLMVQRRVSVNMDGTITRRPRQNQQKIHLPFHSNLNISQSIFCILPFCPQGFDSSKICVQLLNIVPARMETPLVHLFFWAFSLQLYLWLGLRQRSLNFNHLQHNV